MRAQGRVYIDGNGKYAVKFIKIEVPGVYIVKEEGKYLVQRVYLNPNNPEHGYSVSKRVFDAPEWDKAFALAVDRNRIYLEYEQVAKGMNSFYGRIMRFLRRG